MPMSDTPYHILKDNKIQIIQHNTAKSPNVMQTCLENSIKTADVVLIQEPYMSNDHVTISHPTFINIIPNNATRPRVMTFIKKDSANHMTITPRPNIYQDSDIQVLDISRHDLPNILIFNVYNEKQIDIKNDEYTVNRVLSKIDLSARSIIYSDFNTHHS